MLEIIPLNKKDDDNFSPRGYPISYDELSVDSSLVIPPSVGGPYQPKLDFG